MPSYAGKQLTRYKHVKPTKLVNTLLRPLPHTYGAFSQQPTPPDNSPPLNETNKKFVQQVTGNFLYYGRAVNPLILHALSNIASQQANPTENTKGLVQDFLNYMLWHHNATIRYHASDMILNVHSDVSYMTAPTSRSYVGNHYFLGSLPIGSQPIKLNEPIHSLCTIIKFVASLAAESELRALFLNARKEIIMRITLHELGTNNHQHQSMLTTLPSSALPTIQSNVNIQDQWKCAISGSLMVKPKNILISITTQDKKT